ncbi:MAG: type I-E CRISPR-associated protein Cas7/Cse4/CasC [Planctomycetes bacterium]|nr:type I-E CRISPR-associated protein Cas7/Cse4/CasC [Planctomycetota bacterium]
MTKIELHILQNFAPSNLNRDDTGAPKDCEFGGHRRARISSQCFKRAIREAFKVGGEVDASMLGARTKRLVEQVAEALVAEGHTDNDSIAAATAAVEGAGFGVKGAEENHKTEYLLFLPMRAIQDIAKLLHENWPAIAQVVESGKGKPENDDKPKKQGAKKAQAKAEFPKDLGKRIAEVMKNATKTPDIALFGRMIADDPSWNVEAACQVAQAISTNRMAMDFDFFTAVDDLRSADTTGSDMMGTVQFSSGCFYRYLVVDCAALRTNLGDGDMLEPSLRGFLRAAIEAIPTGKQNSMAAHNPPSYVLAIVRSGGAPVSLANAFLKPARPREDSDLVDVSIAALENYFASVKGMSGSRHLQKCISVADRTLPAGDGITRASEVNALISAVLAASTDGAGRA